MRIAPLLFALAVQGLVAGTVAAGTFVCKSVDAGVPGHGPAVVALEEALGMPPADVLYCSGSTPRWTARWDPFESLDGWRLFATAVCFERDTPIECRVVRHAVVPDSHEVIDLEYPIQLARVIELFGAARRDYPDFEVTEIKYVEVTDGGAWSAEAYGYNVRLLEPPEFTGGDIMTYVRRCAGGCGWVTGPALRAGSWTSGSGGASLRDMARRSGDPMIDYLDYLGR